MSTSRRIYVICDNDDCSEAVMLEGDASKVKITEARVRDMAASSGWSREKPCDFCPRHRTDVLINVLGVLS